MSQQSKTFKILIWAGTLVFGFIPSLITYLIKLGDSGVQAQSKEALNWSITMFIAWIAASILGLFLGGWVWSLAWLINIVICIMAIVACANGDKFESPFAIRLIK